MAGFKEQICDQVAKIGVDCSVTAIPITITVWHLLLVAALSIPLGFAIHFLMRYANIGRGTWKQSVDVTSHKNGSVNYPNTLMLNSHRMRDMLKIKDLDGLSLIQTAQALNERFEKDFFLVQFLENGSLLFQKEFKIRAGWRMINYNEFRTDPETLKVVKAKSASDEDDDTVTSVGAIGEFSLFARSIKPWDVRHWLHHPNREIRIGLWVAMFAAALEFGPDLISSLRALFVTP